MTFDEWIRKLKEAGERAGRAPWELIGEYKKDSDYKIKLPNGRVFKIGDAIYHEYDFDAAFITLARNEWDTMISLLESYREALEMGAFHHNACESVFYDDRTINPNWTGFGDHRLPRPCTCSHKKVDEALTKEPWREK